MVLFYSIKLVFTIVNKYDFQIVLHGGGDMCSSSYIKIVDAFLHDCLILDPRMADRLFIYIFINNTLIYAKNYKLLNAD